MVQQQLLRNRYEIHSVLGEGGFATTYQGIDTHTQTQVAIKTLSFAQMQDWKALESFERESIVLARLDHPGIPKYIDFFYEDTETDRCFYLVRELAVGESLSDLAKKGWRAREEEIKHIIEQLLEILVYLHNLIPPVIHRDIKPSNIIYQPDTGKVFLIDFGSVQDAFGGGTFVGTFGYIAPEQLRGETSPRSDIYSVAMTLAFLLTQREPSELPFQRMKINLRSLKISASKEILEWLEKASEPIPDDRFYSAEHALRSLRDGIQKRLELPRGSKIEVLENKNYIKIKLPWIGSAKDYISPDVITVYQGVKTKHIELSTGIPINSKLYKNTKTREKKDDESGINSLGKLLSEFMILLSEGRIALGTLGNFLDYLTSLILPIIDPSGIITLVIVVIATAVFVIVSLLAYLIPVFIRFLSISIEFVKRFINNLTHLVFIFVSCRLNRNCMILEISKNNFLIHYEFRYFPKNIFEQFKFSTNYLSCTRKITNRVVEKVEVFANKDKIVTFNTELMTYPELSWLYGKISSFLDNKPEKEQDT